MRYLVGVYEIFDWCPGENLSVSQTYLMRVLDTIYRWAADICPVSWRQFIFFLEIFDRWFEIFDRCPGYIWSVSWR